MSKERKKDKRELDVSALPTLPSGWCWATVEQIGSPNEQTVLTGPFGSTLGREDFVNQGVPLLTIGCLTEQGITLDKAFYVTEETANNLGRYRVREGDLLFSRSASVGRAGYITRALEGCVINYHLMRLRLTDEIMRPQTFIYYVRGSETVRKYLREVNHGATRDGINTTDLLGMPVAVPPLAEQKRFTDKIEELFSDLDAGVAALQRAKAKLKRYRAAVLKAAVEGRLTEQWRAENPAQEPASKLLERILKQRRKKWEQDQLAAFEGKSKQPPTNWRDKYQEPAGPDTANLPNLPDGWCWATVEQVSEIQGGIQKQPKRAPKSNAFPYLRVANVHRDRLDLSEIQYFELFGDELSKLRLEHGDLLVVEGNGSKTEIGRSAIWQEKIKNCVHQNHIIRVRFRAGLPAFVNIYWNSPAGNGRIMEKAASTSGLYTLSVAKVSSLPIPLAPAHEQSQICTEVEERLSVLDQAVAIVDSNLRRAARLRQSILKRAFEGKLVPQDPADEPASVLLERIKTPAVDSGTIGGSRKSAGKTRRRAAATKKTEISQ